VIVDERTPEQVLVMHEMVADAEEIHELADWEGRDMPACRQLVIALKEQIKGS
jgi:hypothetical protein